MAEVVPKIAYAQITNSYWGPQALDNIRSAKPFVDYTILVHDGISADIENELKALGTVLINTPFNHNFPAFRNNYIEAARKLGADYLLFTDTDEHMDQMALASLKAIVMSAPQYNGFEFLAHYEITNSELMDKNEISREAPNGLGDKTGWWKLCMIRVEPDMHYTGNGDLKLTHEILVSGQWRMLKLPSHFFFTQSKTAQQVWRNCARQVVMDGGGVSVGNENPFYAELTPILKELNVADWTEFEKYCIKGNIDPRIKELMHRYRNASVYRWDSEVRGFWKWYFVVLHSEENVDNLKSEFLKHQYHDALHDWVRQQYFAVLGRDADLSGLNHYCQIIREGRLKMEDLPTLLAQSDEFKRNMIATSYMQIMGRQVLKQEEQIMRGMMDAGAIDPLKFANGLVAMREAINKIPIAYCQMTYKGDVDKAIINVKAAKQYVDSCIVVYDDTLNQEQISALLDAGAIARYYKWTDNFPDMRNNYIKEAWYSGAKWVMVSDPDEHFDEHLLSKIRDIIAEATRVGANMLMTPAHDIWTDGELGEAIDTPIEVIPDYKKNLIYALAPDVSYVGVGVKKNLHETMTGNFKTGNLPAEFFYRHTKSHVEVWEHAARNIFVGGGGDNLGDQNPTYRELKVITDRLGFQEWKNFRQYLVDGNVDRELKDWMLRHRSDYEHSWDSESREFFKWYFLVLHRNEWEAEGRPEIAPEPEKKLDEVQQSVRDMYIRVLGREPDYTGFEYYTNEIRNGRIDLSVLAQTLQASEEYKRRLVAPSIAQPNLQAA